MNDRWSVIGAFVVGLSVGLLLAIPMFAPTIEGWKEVAAERADWALRAQCTGWDAGYSFGLVEGQRKAADR